MQIEDIHINDAHPPGTVVKKAGDVEPGDVLVAWRRPGDPWRESPRMTVISIAVVSFSSVENSQTRCAQTMESSGPSRCYLHDSHQWAVVQRVVVGSRRIADRLDVRFDVPPRAAVRQSPTRAFRFASPYESE